jgi:protein TonB
MKAPAGLQQLTVVGAVALVHVAGLWALLGQTLQPATAALAPQVATVMLLNEPAAAATPPIVQLPPPPQVLPTSPRVAPPEVSKHLPISPPPEPAATAVPTPVAEPVSTERPLPSSETTGAAAVAAAPSAAEDRASAPLQLAKAAAMPRAARHIQNVDYLRAPVLEYPSASRRFGEQGRVVLRVLIGPDGQAEKIELHEASAFQRLNEAAIDAAQRALYKPYTEDGVAQPAWALVALSFQLRR